MRSDTPRWLAAAATLPALAWAVVATPVFYGQLLVACPQSLCTRFERPTPPTLAVLDRIGMPVSVYAGTVTTLAWAELLLLAGVSVLVASSRVPRLLGAVTAVFLTGTALAPFGQALAGAGGVAATLDLVRATTTAACVPVFVGLFPDGRWHPVWFRWCCPLLVAVEVAQVIGPALIGQAFDDATLAPVPGVLTFVLYLGAQVHRFRRVSDWVARQQAKWVVGAFALMVLNSTLAVVAVAADVIAGYQLVAVALAYLTYATLGVGMWLALLRYRLYDVDVVLRRTVVYAVAIVAVAAAYIGLVAAASVLVTAAAAPTVGAVGVAVLALAGSVAAYLLRERIRRRLLGGYGLPRAVAALAQHGTPPGNLAETIASGMTLPYAAVLGANGTVLWAYGTPPGAPIVQSVVDGSGAELGRLLLGPPRGTGRLDRHHRRVLAEVFPYVVLILRARAEADELRRARAVAATAREDERRRLRRDLHDGVGPLLAGQLLTLDTMRLGGDRSGLLEHLETQARSAIGEVRRVADDLRPQCLDAGGLHAALATESTRLAMAGLPVRLDVELGDVVVPAAAEVATLRIAQEALTNVVKHADATGASVRLRAVDGALDLVITDDGRGRGAGPDGIGTESMRERARELGGRVSSAAGPGGAGTAVHAVIPLGPGER